ncbi:NUP170 [Candida pseudojiufengensis]|uniref:NUP170 n=1 Tax=Candida pseudojiufengensis TaxID=497109 RepID=UPI0022247D03|nr:NUP170 [Candida pseudojiufengensis]KAI5960396.1 NUP170 [Candida pseudojiufengensis]
MVSLVPNFTGYGNQNHEQKYISPTIHLKDPVVDESLKFHQDQYTSSNSSRNQIGKRFVQPIGLEVKEANYKINIPDFSNLPPLQLGLKFISNINKIDSSIPHDIFYSETLSKNESSLDNYYFDYENGLKDFSRFEKIQQLNLPDKFFEEYNKTETITKIGLFPEIERTWIAIDNKLILWNYKIPQSSFNKNSQFLTIDQIENTILTVKLVKPRQGVFLKEINHLLLVSTTVGIKIFIVKYDKSFNNLEVFNPNLSVATQGLAVNHFVVHPKTNEIYFSGENDGVNIWRLDYSNKSTFTKNKCDKICLTKGGLSSVIPNKFSSFGFSTSNGSTNNNVDQNLANIPEKIAQLEIDPARDVLYSLSNKSVIRSYKLQAKQESLTESSQLTPSQIFKSASSLFVDTANIKVFERFKIISIHVIPPEESSVIQLIAVTSNGSRILLKAGTTSSFSSLLTSTYSSSNALRLNLVNIKFPPTREIPTVNNELDAFTRDRQYISQIIADQQKSQLLKNTKLAKIISPGVFLCVKKTKRSDKLFIATANFGYLKKNNKLVEDAEFLKYTLNDDSPYTYIQDIVQLTPSMNATNTPNGYANIAASQYTKEPLKFAILTNFGIIIYQFKTSDQILKSLNDEIIENFIEENGYEETCSTLLYLACSYGNSNEFFERKAQVLFSSCGNNARLMNNQSGGAQATSLIPHHQLSNISSSHPTVDQVILSDRFYGTCLLIARFLRDIWNKKVFSPIPTAKITPSGDIETASIKDHKVILKSINIDKKQIEYFIGTIVVLIDFFVENETSIQGLNAPNYSTDPSQFENEVCLRAESIAFTSIFKSLTSMKEAFSFLMVLLEELQANNNEFNSVFDFLSLPNQANLLSISFRDLLLPNREIKNLIKDLLSSIINSNIVKGGSIDVIASSLQTRCGSFCSTNDVFIFKAIENLTKAKKIGSRDVDLKLKCLKNAVLLFEESYETLTLENIENSVDIMVDLEYYSGAIGMLLNITSKLGNSLKTPNFVFNQVNENLMKKNHQEIQTKIKKLYEIVFNVLKQVDLKALKITETNNQLQINEILEIRDAAYDTCFVTKDKEFQYSFYDWFVDQGISDRLLELNTPYILPYLEEKSENNIAMSNILWLYYAKRENYFDAAKILYALSISQFNLDLSERIEYLSRANGFCNCVCPPNFRQKMIQLSATIQELFDVANIQLNLISRIERDSRINSDNKKNAVEALNYKILSISDLFNTYVDPLGYYELSLLIFKVSDYKNNDDILKRWELLIDKIYLVSESSKEPFYILLNDDFTIYGPKLSSNDIVFPIDELIKLIGKTLHKAIKNNPVTQEPPKGYLVELFVKAGVSYERLYYNIRSLIEHNSFDSSQGFIEYLKTNEMTYLIKKWYSTDKKLKELIAAEQMVSYGNVYSLDTDPIKNSVF